MDVTAMKPNEIFGCAKPTTLGNQALRKRISQWTSQGNSIIYFDIETSNTKGE